MRPVDGVKPWPLLGTGVDSSGHADLSSPGVTFHPGVTTRSECSLVSTGNRVARDESRCSGCLATFSQGSAVTLGTRASSSIHLLTAFRTDLCVSVLRRSRPPPRDRYCATRYPWSFSLRAQTFPSWHIEEWRVTAYQCYWSLRTLAVSSRRWVHKILFSRLWTIDRSCPAIYFSNTARSLSFLLFFFLFLSFFFFLRQFQVSWRVFHTTMQRQLLFVLSRATLPSFIAFSPLIFLASA